MGVPPDIEAAYAHCWRIAATHYENFTVGSWLLPRELRKHIAAIYAFARTADDFADEGDLPVEERLARLDAWEKQLDRCYTGAAVDPVFVALQHTIRAFDLPDAPFRCLLAAFRQDVRFESFATFADLEAYCRNSANPVGHLILYLFGYRDPDRQRLSDLICTGLQLANFCQDVSVDARKGRVYIPLDELKAAGCTVKDVLAGRSDERVAGVIRLQVARARRLLTGGLALAECVEKRLAREVTLFARGGLAILDRIEARGFDVFTKRPTVSRSRKVVLVLSSFVLGPRHATPASDVAGAYRYCRDVTRRSSSNFYYAFRLLTPAQRNALYATYAFCRFVDDIADDPAVAKPDGGGDRAATLLERWRAEVDAVYAATSTHPIGIALADAVRRYPLDRRHFLDLIRGVEQDLRKPRYETFDQLYEYCYLVASTVGLLCIEIFGYRNPSARDYALDLGVAFQLTNILRDVHEDARRGRVYLPAEDLERFDCRLEELLGGCYSPRVGALMAFECGRARAYYLRARGSLAPEDRASMAPAEAMRLIYERLLDRIEARHFNVFGPKITLPRYEKLTLALTAWGRSQLASLTG